MQAHPFGNMQAGAVSSLFRSAGADMAQPAESMQPLFKCRRGWVQQKGGNAPGFQNLSRQEQPPLHKLLRDIRIDCAQIRWRCHKRAWSSAGEPPQL